MLAYCDVDLSTDLAALLPLVAPLISGHSDLAIGTRLGRGSRVVRGPKREFISRCYNLLLRGTLQTGFTDAQCGFKAIRADVAKRLLPLVEDTGWFFDTEMLVLAERAGLRIHEVPVDWVDDPDSRVDIVATAVADLRGIWRVGRALGSGALPVAELRAQLGRAPLAPTVPGVPTAMPRQLVRFAAIGVASTLAHLLLFLLFRGVMGAIAANVVALLITSIVNTAANRRLTFGVRGREGAAPAPVPGPDRLRARAGPDDGCARAARVRRARREPGRRAGRDRRSPTPPPPCCGSSCSAPGCSARAPSPSRTSSPRRTRHDRHPERVRLPAHPRSHRGRSPPAAVGAPLPRRAAGRHGGALPVEPVRVRLGQLVLRRGRAGRHAELDGVLLRLARLRQRDHRRQAARLAVGDGAVRADLRLLVVEHARPAGA